MRNCCRFAFSEGRWRLVIDGYWATERDEFVGALATGTADAGLSGRAKGKLTHIE